MVSLRIPCDAGETRLVKCRRYDASIEMERKFGCVVWEGKVVFMVAVRMVLVVVLRLRLTERKNTRRKPKAFSATILQEQFTRTHSFE